MVLYGSPIWSGRVILRCLQRGMAIRMVRVYRMVSFQTAIVHAGILSSDLLAGVEAVVYKYVCWIRSKGSPVLNADVSSWKELYATSADSNRAVFAVLAHWNRWHNCA